MDDKRYFITVEFEKFSKNYEHVTEPKVVPVGNGGDSVLQFTDRKGKTHAYSMRQVLGYHVEEE